MQWRYSNGRIGIPARTDTLTKIQYYTQFSCVGCLDRHVKCDNGARLSKAATNSKKLSASPYELSGLCAGRGVVDTS